MLPFQDAEAEVLLEPIAEHERRSSWHIVRSDDRYSSRGAGAIDLLESLGHPGASAAVARFAGLVERMYSFVAGHRDTLGRFVPDGPAPRRFP